MTAATKTKHGVFARTHRGNYRVGGWSDWRNAQRRWDAATDEGRNAGCEVRVHLEGEGWINLKGDLVVRASDDPGFAEARVANDRKASGTDHVTVRAFDFRKVR